MAEQEVSEREKIALQERAALLVKNILHKHGGIDDAFDVVHESPSTGFHVTGDESTNGQLLAVKSSRGEEFVVYASVGYKTEFEETERHVDMNILVMTPEQMGRFKFRPEDQPVDIFVDALMSARRGKARTGIETGDIDMRRVEFHWKNATNSPERTFSTTANESRESHNLASNLLADIESGNVRKIGEFVQTREIVVREN